MKVLKTSTNIINSQKDDNKFLVVEKILDKKIDNFKIKYLVKWLDYKLEESTWEPLENLSQVIHLINSYENTNHRSSRIKLMNTDKFNNTYLRKNKIYPQSAKNSQDSHTQSDLSYSDDNYIPSDYKKIIKKDTKCKDKSNIKKLSNGNGHKTNNNSNIK